MTVEEAAQRSGYSANWIRDAITARELPAERRQGKKGGAQITEADLAAFVEAQRAKVKRHPWRQHNRRVRPRR